MADEFEMSEREETNETVRQSLVLDQPDGWETEMDSTTFKTYLMRSLWANLCMRKKIVIIL